MTDTTMQQLSQNTDPVKMSDFDILAEGKTLPNVAERLMNLSLTDNRGFEADQLTITLDVSYRIIITPLLHRENKVDTCHIYFKSHLGILE